MALPVNQSTSLPFAGCGNVASPPGSGRDELAAETAIVTGDQSTMTSLVHILEASELQSQETPRNVFQPALADAINLRAATSDVTFGVASSLNDSSLPIPQPNRANALQSVGAGASLSLLRRRWNLTSLDCLPNEILMQILGFLDVNDILTTSRVSHQTHIVHTGAGHTDPGVWGLESIETSSCPPSSSNRGFPSGSCLSLQLSTYHLNPIM